MSDQLYTDTDELDLGELLSVIWHHKILLA